jgi:hypothetical protein
VSLPTRGFTAILAAGVRQQARAVHLFVNDVDTEDPNLERADFREPDSKIYSPRAVGPKDWHVGEDGVEGRTITWFFREPIELYGYFVSDLGGELLWAQRGDGVPWRVPAGDRIEINAAVGPALARR